MSGIAGIIHFDGAPVVPGLMEKMTASMAHRGPDGIRSWIKGSVALGQCMLRTTPESLEEVQPLTNEDESLVLVMDGRVDNWEALRSELLGCGAVLRTRADAELVLRAYETWGGNCVSHVDGDFALVIWDARKREAFCARDRVGNKPFNYLWDGKSLVFASELHAILALPGVREELNEGLVAEFLANEWYSRDETFWIGVMRLVSAHRMVVGASGNRIDRYWRPDPWATLPYKRDEEYVEHYRELLADVVRRMSRSHQPLAFEVSGGLDSSALLAMAEHLRRDGKLPAPAILGYTLEFRDDSEANELEYVRAVSQHLNIPVRAIPPTQMPVSWYRNWARQYREFPSYPNGIMAIGLRNAARAAGSRTILTGEGGDEWQGMPRTGAYYAEELSARQWRTLYNCLKTDAREMGTGTALWWLCRYGVAPILPKSLKGIYRTFQAFRRREPPSAVQMNESWLTAHMRGVIDERRRRMGGRGRERYARRGQAAQMEILDQAYDAMAREFEERMSCSLQIELRKPFYNSAMVQFAFSTPERLRSRGKLTKWTHRQALRGMLPDLVLNRSTKADFMIMFHRTLDSVAKELVEQIVPRNASWIESELAMSICEHYHDAELGGRAAWRLWSLVGCDALSRDH